MFQDMLDRIDTHTTERFSTSKSSSKTSRKKSNASNDLERQRARRQAAGMAFTGAMSRQRGGRRSRKATPFVRDQPKVKPNDPCSCGSGKKYKKCHGAGI
jgi:preprotein translocase subunit SecA